MQNIQTNLSDRAKNSPVPLIQLKKIYKIYKQGKVDVVALKDFSCDFYEGFITVIMGPSGCGKTTLLNMIAGLDSVSSGKIFIDSQEISELKSRQLNEFRAKNIGIIFQFFNLLPHLNALDNVMLPMIYSKIPRSEHQKRAQELIRLVDLSERAHHLPEQMSGGEQQRIAVATALGSDPRILLCDEPTGELDSKNKLQLMTIFRKLIETYPTKVVLIVSHDPDLRKIADRVVLMKDGTVEQVIEQKPNGSLSSIADQIINEEKVQKLSELEQLAHTLNKKIEDLKK